MPVRVNGVAGLGIALRPKISRGSSVVSSPLPAPPTSVRPIIPSLPGCSRWLSCTCCRKTLARRTYFSSNPTSSTSTIHPDEEPSSTTIIPLPHRVKTPHLPLPPPLPYSPNSHPFRRHLEILSLSLFSSPNESWSVYLALHPSLRQYIPDETFRSLLAHQARHEEPALGWHRVKMLLRLAKKCRMELEDLGFENMTNVLKLGLLRILQDNKMEDEAHFKLVKKLWNITSGMVSDLGRIPRKVRRHWLQLQISRLEAYRRNETRLSVVDNPSSTPMEDAVLEIVERGGADGLGYHIGRILSISRGSTVEGLRESLRLMAWCLSRGTYIHTTFLFKVMRKLVSGWDREGMNGRQLLKAEIPKVLSQVETSPTSLAAQQLREVSERVEKRSQSRMERALELLDVGGLGLPGMIEQGMSIAKGAKTKAYSVTAIEAALRLLEESLQHRDVEQSPLTIVIANALYSAYRSGRSIEIAALVVRFVRTPQESQVINRLPSDVIIPLFRLLLTVMPSPEVYILARKIYQHARAADPPFLWSHHNIDAWRTLYKFSVTSPNLHLHFASRLYADLMADGMAIRRTDALMMIRAIGMKPSPSRPILLERHIKDYLWVQYGRQPALIAALVQGLTRTSVKDAELALNLAHRLAENTALQPLVVQLIIAQLARSPRLEHLAKSFSLLSRLEPGATATWAYNTVLSYLVSAGRLRPQDGQMSRGDSLAHATALYKEMIRNDIRPNPRTISIMLRSLLDNDHLDAALAVFGVCVEQQIVLKSSAVGRLMVRLALAGRSEEADLVEQRWRESTVRGEKISWDRGVVGARVLLDIKHGKRVDLGAIAKQTGWNGTPAFLQFLETLRPPSRDDNESLGEAAQDENELSGGAVEADERVTKSLNDHKSSFWYKGKNVEMSSTNELRMSVVF
ncbi:hypothetical protein IAR55_002874 [Kwoniella newhampshirensis]|uniref:Pentatricopeptide repeat domain-containing protein n=1 Tax=Kwoniella newhampshirensis TaxID=1651941 RepID=A0AAW0YZY8_9TREE